MTGASIGLGGKGSFSCGSFANLVEVSMKVERGKYEKGVEWLYLVLNKGVLSPERYEILW